MLIHAHAGASLVSLVVFMSCVVRLFYSCPAINVYPSMHPSIHHPTKTYIKKKIQK